MSRNRIFKRSVAVMAAAVAGFQTFGVSAADTADMTFRLTASQTYLTASDVADGDMVLDGAMYIDNYSGINMMRFVIGNDEGIVIENGGFSDPCFLEGDYNPETSANVYNDYAETFDKRNLVVWYGPGSIWTNGVVADETASLVEFDIRIPQGTAPGRYNIYFDQSVITLSSGKQAEMFYVYNEDGKYGEDDRAAVGAEGCFVTIEPAALRGDVDCNGAITSADAMDVVRYYVMKEIIGETDEMKCMLAMNELYPHTAFEAGDVDYDGTCTMYDGLCILKYFVTETILGKTPDWDVIVG